MWYAANLLFKGSRNAPTESEPLWEESVRLVTANTEDEARAKAQRLGQSEQTSYQVSAGTVNWVFDRIERIYAIEVDTLVDGTEVFSRFLRDSEVVSLLTPFEEE